MYQSIKEYKQPVMFYFQLSKEKEGSAISVVLERKCSKFITERSSRDSLV